jgi:hypothetical protein
VIVTHKQPEETAVVFLRSGGGGGGCVVVSENYHNERRTSIDDGLKRIWVGAIIGASHLLQQLADHKVSSSHG